MYQIDIYFESNQGIEIGVYLDEQLFPERRVGLKEAVKVLLLFIP